MVTKTAGLDHFLYRSREVHGDKYDYSKSKYEACYAKLLITCKRHGDFSQSPSVHYSGRGCPKCWGGSNRDSQGFTLKAEEVHGKKYDYSQVVYTKAHTHVSIVCTLHGAFLQTPNNHLKGKGCPHCAACYSTPYSKAAIAWLRQEARERGIRIRHAENWGEVQLPGTRIRVDGYHKPSNTVFEFHGDCWHGNPKVHAPYSRPHPFRTNTYAHHLYSETIEREELIRSMGYNLIVRWESDFKQD